MVELFGEYALGAAWDEMFQEPGVPRSTYQAVLASLERFGPAELRDRADQLSRTFTDRGVTFAHAGEERPFPLDLLPRVIASPEWEEVVAGVQQRVRALEAFLADVYGTGQVFADGVIPRRVVTTSHHFHRAAFGIDPPRGVRVHVAGIDLIRDEAGRVPRPGGQPAGALRRELRDREPPRDDDGCCPACSRSTGCTRSTSTRPGCWRRCGRAHRRGCATRSWSCSPRVSTTPPTSSTRCSPG